MSLKINTKAPDFSLPSTEGKDFTLFKDAAGRSLVLFFYPKDFTPGCTRESCEFRDQFKLFEEKDVLIYGISTDNIETHHKFREKHNLPFHLLADVNGEVSRLYKAKIPLLNISKRVTYLLDKEHNIKAAFQELFGYESHISEMLDKIEED